MFSRAARRNNNANSTEHAEQEPRALCGLPISGAIGILGSLLMICQIFGLFYLSPFVLYFFEIAIGSAMMFILSAGAKQRKIAYITAYMLYISMYTFWVFFLMIGDVMATIWLVNQRKECRAENTATCPPENEVITTGELEMIIISCVFLSISIIVAVVQMRYLVIFYNFLRRSTCRISQMHPDGVNVQYIVPTPISPNGLPPPPRYSSRHPSCIEPGPINKPPISQGEVNLTSTSIDEETRARCASQPPPYESAVNTNETPIIENRNNTDS